MWGTPRQGYPLGRSDWGRGGTWGGVPTCRGTSWPGLPEGYPRWGTPVGVPPGQVCWRVPKVGYPTVGVPLARSNRGYPRWGSPGRGTPRQVQWGVPKVGYPQQRYPLVRSDGGYLRWGPPGRGAPPRPGLMGVHKVGYPQQGYPLPGPGQGTPPIWTWLGYPPRYGQTDGRMDG